MALHILSGKGVEGFFPGQAYGFSLIDLNDDGIPDFNYGIGRIVISNADPSAALTMFGGVTTFAQPDAETDFSEGGFIYKRQATLAALFQTSPDLTKEAAEASAAAVLAARRDQAGIRIGLGVAPLIAEDLAQHAQGIGLQGAAAGTGCAVGRNIADSSLRSARAQLVLDATQAFYDAALTDRLVAIAEASLERPARTAGATCSRANRKST